MKMIKRVLLLVLLTAAFYAIFHRSRPEKIHLVWQVDKNGSWEPDWLAEVLAKVDYEEVQDGRFRVLKDNSIVVFSPLFKKEKVSEYFEKLKKKGYKFGVIWLSDEHYSTNPDFCKDAKFILKNHWHKKYLSEKNLLVFPLGYKTGFWKGSSTDQISAVSKREFTWSFAGDVGKSTRVAMMENMKKIPGYFIHEIHSWGDPKSLTAQAYRDVLLKTIFVPCPKGWWNLDSFRVYEALECGCIPIVEKSPLDYFTKFLGNHPFLSVSSWDEAPALIESLLADPVRLEEHRSKCHQWWLEYKVNMQTEVRDLVEASFHLGDNIEK